MKFFSTMFVLFCFLSVVHSIPGFVLFACLSSFHLFSPQPFPLCPTVFSRPRDFSEISHSTLRFPTHPTSCFIDEGSFPRVVFWKYWMSLVFSIRKLITLKFYSVQRAVLGDEGVHNEIKGMAPDLTV